MALKQAALARRPRSPRRSGESVAWRASAPPCLRRWCHRLSWTDFEQVKVGAVHVRSPTCPSMRTARTPALGLRLDVLLVATSRVERSLRSDFDAVPRPETNSRTTEVEAGTRPRPKRRIPRRDAQRTAEPRRALIEITRWEARGQGPSRYNLRGLLAMVHPSARRATRRGARPCTSTRRPESEQRQRRGIRIET